MSTEELLQGCAGNYGWIEDTCCAACAPTDLRKVAVETEVCRLEPRGSILSWRAISGPIACPTGLMPDILDRADA
jgi:hypothetical protein